MRSESFEAAAILVAVIGILVIFNIATYAAAGGNVTTFGNSLVTTSNATNGTTTITPTSTTNSTLSTSSSTTLISTITTTSTTIPSNALADNSLDSTTISLTTTSSSSSSTSSTTSTINNVTNESVTALLKPNLTANDTYMMRRDLGNVSSYSPKRVGSILSRYQVPFINNQTNFNSTNLTAVEVGMVRTAFSGTAQNLSEVNLTVQYGSIRPNGRYAGMGRRYYLGLGPHGEVLYNLTVAKATPKLSVNVDGYNISAGNVSIIHLPIVNGSLGINGGSTYTISGNLSTSLLNNVELNYSITIGGSSVVNYTLNSSTLNLPFKFTVPLSQNATIRFDSQGGANYSAIDPTVVIVPTKIVYAIPITFTNTAGTALRANTPLAVGVGAGGTVTGINANSYSQFYTCDLNNAEFFYPNGTIVTSWLEGNVLDELYANSLCTSAASPNALVNSGNVLYWVKIGINAPSFLPANTGTATTNTIYLGWAGNVLSVSNTLFNTATTGEAGQLSCSTPTNSFNCNPTTVNGVATGAYSQYDTGNQVFSFYDDFGGTALSALWSGTKGGTSTVTVKNSLEIATTTTSNSGLISTGNFPAYPYWTEEYLLPATTKNAVKTFGVAVGNSSTFNIPNGYNYAFMIGSNTPANVIPLATTLNAIPTRNTVVTSSGVAPELLGVAWVSNGLANNEYQYTTNVMTGNTPHNAIANEYFSIMTLTSGTGSASYNGFLQWVRSRVYPPNGILPSTTLGSQLCTVSLNPLSNVVVDVGQTENLIATEGSCVSTYTYNFLVVNSITTGTIAHNSLLQGSSSSSASYAFAAVQSDVFNSPEEGNVILIDSGANTVVSAYTSTFRIYNALSIPKLSATGQGSNLYAGQEATYFAAWTGGNAPYTVVYNVFNSVTNTLFANQVYTGVVGTTNSFVWNVPALFVGNTLYANVMVTDSATTNVLANSVLTAASNVIYPTTPSGVLYYLPLTFINYQVTAVAANTPLPVATTAKGQILGFNALAYSQYYTCNLNNAEFFFANGTVADSWLEGNFLNEQTANTQCTSSSSVNALVNTKNALYWVTIPTNSFLPANTGAPTQNTLFIGWAGNVLSPSNTLFNNINTGEAPQLSCNVPALTITGCAAGQYAQYDDGNQVFSFYDAFIGSSLSSLWSGTHGGTGSVTVQNSLSLNTIAINSIGIVSASSYPAYPYLQTSYILTSTTNTAGKYFGPEISNTPTFGTNGYDYGFMLGSSTSLIDTPLSFSATGGLTANTALISTAIRPQIVGVGWIGNGIASNHYNYNTNSVTGATAHNAIGNEYFDVVVAESSTLTFNGVMQWTRGRVYPPNGIVPATMNGLVIQAPIVSNVCFISLSNTVVNFGNINPGFSVNTANAITDSDVGGNAAANVFIAGGLGTLPPLNGIWVGTSPANQIGISNTLYSLSSQGSYSGTPITNTITNTGIVIPNPGGGTASNTIYLGMAVPLGAPADTYTTNIIIENSC